VQHVPLAGAGPVEVDPDAAGTKKKKKRRRKKQSEMVLDFAAQLGEPFRSEANDKSPDRPGGGILDDATCLSILFSLPAGAEAPMENGGKAGKGGGGSSGGAPAAKAKMQEVSTEKRLKTPTT
jgi:hypothetical protein